MWATWSLSEGISLPTGVPATIAGRTVIKMLVWLGPAIPFVLKKDEEWLILPEELFKNKFPWLPTLTGVCLTAMFLHTMHIVLVGIGTWSVFRPIYVFLSFSAAVIEEFAFRGFLFNRQAVAAGVKTAAFMNGLLFALYHFPEFLAGENLSALFGFRFWMIAVMGCMFSLLFSRWKHLGMTIVIHFFWNLLCYWFALF